MDGEAHGPEETQAPMKVFLAGIIQGSLVEPRIHNQDWRGPIKRALRRHLPKAHVYCHYSEHPGSIAYELPDIRATLADGIRRAGRCDLLVAYVPAASMGTAIEMHEAARSGAVVLAITTLAANWVIRAYSDRVFPDVAAFEDFLAGDGLGELLKRKRSRRRTRP